MGSSSAEPLRATHGRSAGTSFANVPFDSRCTTEADASRIDEKSIRDADPVELTRKLAEAKARTVAAAHPDAVIVSGDAVVLKDGTIFEKHSRRMRSGRPVARVSSRSRCGTPFAPTQ